MNGNNDLIIAIKAALMDSRSEFTADTHNGKNAALCEKAIKRGLINLQTCPEAKLSANHRSLRLGLNPPSVVSVKNQKPKKKSIVIPAVSTENNSSDDDDKSLSDLSETEAEIDQDETQVKTNIVSDDTNIVVAVEHERQKELTDDNGGLPCQEEDKDKDKDEYEAEIYFDPDIENRRERTIFILDHLNKSLCGTDDCVLSEEILKVLESIFK
jgi:hypothetical protein